MTVDVEDRDLGLVRAEDHADAGLLDVLGDDLETRVRRRSRLRSPRARRSSKRAKATVMGGEVRMKVGASFGAHGWYRHAARRG